MVNFYEPREPVVDEEELARIRAERLRMLGGAAPQAPAPAPAPMRVSELPLPVAPGGQPDFRESMANLLDAQGNRVLNPTPEALRPFAARLSDQEMRETGPAADAYSAQLAAYQALPRNEALFAQVAAPPPMTDEQLLAAPPGTMTVQQEDDLIARGLLPPIGHYARGPQRVGDLPLTNDPFFTPEQTMTSEQERALAARQRQPEQPPYFSEAAQAPSFAQNEAVVANATQGGQPERQTEPDAGGNTYPDYGTLRDELNREYRLVQVGGTLMVYDPRRDEWTEFRPDDWSIAGRRRARGG
jgi:hypothetical protein